MARPLESVRDVSRIGYAFMSSQALFAALELGLFTELDRQPASTDDLAAKLEVVPEALQTLLANLVAEKLIVSDGGQYSNSPAAERYLVTGAPNDYSEYLRLQVGRQLYSAMPHIVAGLRGNEGAMVNRGTGLEGLAFRSGYDHRLSGRHRRGSSLRRGSWIARSDRLHRRQLP